MLRYAARVSRGRRPFDVEHVTRKINASLELPCQRSQVVRWERRFKSSNPVHEDAPSKRIPGSNKQKSQSNHRQRKGDGRRFGQGFGKNKNNQASNAPLRTNNFLQTLRVGPSSRNPAAAASQETSKLSGATKNQPFFPGRGARDSAAKPNLQGSSNPSMSSPDLIAFFNKRLEKAKDGIEKAENKFSPRFSSHDNKRSNRTIPKPPLPQPQGRKNSFGGLNAAMAEARVAQTNMDQPTGNQNPASFISVRDALAPNQAAANEQKQDQANQSASIASDDSNPETISPLRQFILEIKKSNKRKEEEGLSTKDALEEPDVPSWRKSARSGFQNRQQMVDPLFLSRHRNQNRWQNQQTQQQHPKERTKDQPAVEAKKPTTPKPREVVLPLHDATLLDVSKLFGVKVDKLMDTLRSMGEDPKRDDSYTLDTDMMEMLAMELNIKFIRPTRRLKEDNDHKTLMDRRKANEESAETSPEVSSYQTLPTRPPVVCIMGHVDHGKTTLMDALRRRAGPGVGKKKSTKSKGKKQQKGVSGGDVAGTEAGGITQVISAFQVPLAGEKDAITFLDTPGHAAFSAMRQSGSHAADILVLVIAADDGVSPQTVEIINFYKSIVKDSNGGISMVVAMNKIDKPGIDIEESKRRIENQLLEHGIIPEGVGSHNESEFGSPVQFFPISAKNGEGLDDLIDGLSLQSEVMDLRADDSARAEGIVMDARVEQGLGVVADCIIRWGSIKRSDVVVSGTHTGKVRILKDVNDKTLKKGTPSQPVRIVGFKTAPKAGDPIVCVASEEKADELIERRLAIQEKKKANGSSDDPNANFSEFIITGRESMTAFGTEKTLQKYDIDLEDKGPIRIPIIVKAKADGSVAAVRDSLQELGRESSFDINIDTIAQGVGPLTRSEVEMAKESDACVFCFDIKNQDKSVLALAEAEGVKVMEYDVIYSLLDDAKDVFMEYLPPVPLEVVHGKAAVQAIFSISGGKETIAGLKVTEGTLYKSKVEKDNKKSEIHFRVIRNGERVSPEGETIRASSLKKFKEDVENVRNGEECGLSLFGFVDYEEGDIIECYSVEMKKSFA